MQNFFPHCIRNDSHLSGSCPTKIALSRPAAKTSQNPHVGRQIQIQIQRRMNNQIQQQINIQPQLVLCTITSQLCADIFHPQCAHGYVKIKLTASCVSTQSAPHSCVYTVQWTLTVYGVHCSPTCLMMTDCTLSWLRTAGNLGYTLQESCRGKYFHTIYFISISSQPTKPVQSLGGRVTGIPFMASRTASPFAFCRVTLAKKCILRKREKDTWYLLWAEKLYEIIQNWGC